MKQYLQFSVIYLAFATILVFAVRPMPLDLIAGSFGQSFGLLKSFSSYLPYLGIALACVLYLTRTYCIKSRIVPTLNALAGCFIFTVAFSMVKTTIPYLIPFYADTFLANLDQAMHFGMQPYELAHWFNTLIPADAVVIVYFVIWTGPALFLPVIIALTDADEERGRRFVAVHVLTWLVLGNLVATIGSSVGPVYYDRLLGGDRFAGLTEALSSSGMAASKLGAAQDTLWKVYIDNGQAIGSGISSFPSMHVAMATVTMLYLAERYRRLAPVAVAYLGVVMFCSVYNGWHYAIDGYASVLVTITIYAILRRRNVAFASTLSA